MRTRLRSNAAVPPTELLQQGARNQELACFIQGLWTGIGIAAVAGLAAWLITRRVQEIQEERTLDSRIDRATGTESFTVGDYSGIYSNELFREQALELEESYAARQRNLQTIQESLGSSDLRGRTEMKPWLEVE